jgi:hypothetical protein
MTSILSKATLLIFVTCTITISPSCNSSKETTETKVQGKPEPVSFVELDSGTNSGFSERKNQIILTQNEYNAAWTQAYKNYFKKPKPQQVDFETSQLILVAMGEQNSGSHDLKVSSIEENNTYITITIEESKPGASCMTTSVMTYPYQMVSIKKSDKEIIFKTDVKVLDCEE